MPAWRRSRRRTPSSGRASTTPPAPRRRWARARSSPRRAAAAPARLPAEPGAYVAVRISATDGPAPWARAGAGLLPPHRRRLDAGRPRPPAVAEAGVPLGRPTPATLDLTIAEEEDDGHRRMVRETPGIEAAALAPSRMRYAVAAERCGERAAIRSPSCRTLARERRRRAVRAGQSAGACCSDIRQAIEDVLVTEWRPLREAAGADSAPARLLGQGLLTADAVRHAARRRAIAPGFHRPRMAGYGAIGRRPRRDGARRRGVRATSIDAVEEMASLDTGDRRRGAVQRRPGADRRGAPAAAGDGHRRRSIRWWRWWRRGVSCDRRGPVSKRSSMTLIAQPPGRSGPAGRSARPAAGCRGTGGDAGAAPGRRDHAAARQPRHDCQRAGLDVGLAGERSRRRLTLLHAEVDGAARRHAPEGEPRDRRRPAAAAAHPRGAGRVAAAAAAGLDPGAPCARGPPRSGRDDRGRHAGRDEPRTWSIAIATLLRRSAALRSRPLARTADAPARPKLAYFPFGAGRRSCIGEGFAWLEGILVLATLARRWRLETIGGKVAPDARITLRPRGPMPMRLVARRSGAA